MDEYYKLKGWNKQGVPTKESLHELDLDYVIEDFIQKGILKDRKDTPTKKASSKAKKK